MQLYIKNRIFVWGALIISNSPSDVMSVLRGQDFIFGLAATTGGKAYAPRNLREIEDTFRRLSQLRQYYIIKFIPATTGKTNSSLHKVQVKLMSAKNPNKEIKDLVVLPAEYYLINQ